MDVLVLLHLLGMAIIVGSYFAHVKSPKVVAGMLHGTYLQLVTGLAMVAILSVMGADLNHVAVTLKVLLAVAVWVFAFLGRRKEKAADPDASPHPSALFSHLTGGAAVLAVIVAVFVL